MMGKSMKTLMIALAGAVALSGATFAQAQEEKAPPTAETIEASKQLFDRFMRICAQPRTRIAKIEALAEEESWASLDPTAFVDFSKYGTDRDGSNLVDQAWSFGEGEARFMWACAPAPMATPAMSTPKCRPLRTRRIGTS